jgi:23S rRNA (uridine2479-2'-O)-methyltransferase
VPVVEVEGRAELQRWLAAPAGRCGGPGPAAETPLHEVALTGPVAVVAGNEGAGLSHGLRALCDRMQRIPMAGAADSLNVTVAASIVLYEASRQRGAARTTTIGAR